MFAMGRGTLIRPGPKHTAQENAGAKLYFQIANYRLMVHTKIAENACSLSYNACYSWTLAQPLSSIRVKTKKCGGYK